MEKSDRKRMKTERGRIKKHKAEVLEKLEAETKVRVRFVNAEFDGADLTFNYEGVKDYRLVHNGIYDLPPTIINHLNGLGYPRYKMYESDEVEKGLVLDPAEPETRIVGRTQRFNVIPTNIVGVDPQPHITPGGEKVEPSTKEAPATH